MATAPAELGAAPGVLEPIPVEAGGRGRWRTLAAVWIPAGLLILIFGLCFIWPLIGPVGKPTGGSILNANLPMFSPGHVLGTDETGNDEWARILYGGRNSLEIALAVTALGITVGGMLGALAGYLGGWRDGVIMRILDVFIAFPALVLAVAVAEGLGPSKTNTIWALTFFSVPAFARIARAETLRIRGLEFMTASRLSGSGHLRILLRHVAPNILPQLITFALLGIGITVVLEGALSFLGLGVPAPTPSWGNMIASGQAVLSAQPRFVFVPSVALFITVFCFNLLGDALRARWSAR